MIIGITGNIGSGKSLATKHLQKLGAFTIDADEVSRNLMTAGSEAAKQVEAQFGSEYFDEDGNLLRKKLGALVFADKKALRRLEAITQPAIDKSIREQLAADKTPVQVVEAALFIEAGWLDIVDELWLIEADDEIRVRRVMERNDLPEQQVRERMNNQMPQQEKRRYAQRIITNNGTTEQFLQAVEQAYNEICAAL